MRSAIWCVDRRPPWPQPGVLAGNRAQIDRLEHVAPRWLAENEREPLTRWMLVQASKEPDRAHASDSVDRSAARASRPPLPSGDRREWPPDPRGPPRARSRFVVGRCLAPGDGESPAPDSTPVPARELGLGGPGAVSGGEYQLPVVGSSHVHTLSDAGTGRRVPGMGRASCDPRRRAREAQQPGARRDAGM